MKMTKFGYLMDSPYEATLLTEAYPLLERGETGEWRFKITVDPTAPKQKATIHFGIPGPTDPTTDFAGDPIWTLDGVAIDVRHYVWDYEAGAEHELVVNITLGQNAPWRSKVGVTVRVVPA